MPDIRLAVVTPYFPFQADPFRGQLSYRTLRRLPPSVMLRVFSPIATYPRQRWLHPRSYRYQTGPAYTALPGVPAEYFEYPVIPLATRPFNSWTCLRRLLPRLRAWKPDVILNYWLYPEGHAALMAGEKLGVPVVVGSIGSDLRRIPDAISRFYTRKTLQRASAVITVSEELKARAVALGAPLERVTTVAGGCDLTLFHPQPRQEARARLDVEADARVILFVGNLLPAKGVRELLEAFEPMCRQIPRAQLVIVGQGPLAPLVGELATRRSVRLLSRLPDEELAQWYCAADVLTLPSHSEGMPNVILEALASGRPVVATRVGGIPETVSEDDGILIEPANPEALRRALLQALERSWDESGIATRHGRSWDDSARETLAVCHSVRR